LRWRACCYRKGCLVAVLAGMFACDGGKTLEMGAHAPFAGCDPSPRVPPAALGLDPFYVKYLDGRGTPVVSSAKVSDEALRIACRITGTMVALREDVRSAMASNNHRVVVIAEGEQTTDIPEYADLYSVFPNTDWNTYRAVSPTPVRPISSTSEENLRCLPGDRYEGDSALVWTLGHGLLELGILDIDPAFGSKLQAAYTSAMAKGLWAKTSATASVDDYWAVGSQAWFGASTHLPVASRDELASYDGSLADLLGAYLPANDWRPSCYGS
jgi:hypothetical protein